VMALTLAAAAGSYLCLLMLFRVDLRALMRQRARN
jgi:hypothetical protein